MVPVESAPLASCLINGVIYSYLTTKGDNHRSVESSNILHHMYLKSTSRNGPSSSFSLRDATTIFGRRLGGFDIVFYTSLAPHCRYEERIDRVHVTIFRGISSMLPVLCHYPARGRSLCSVIIQIFRLEVRRQHTCRWCRSILYEPVWWRQSHLAEIFAGAITPLNSHKRELSWERNHSMEKGAERKKKEECGGSWEEAQSDKRGNFFLLFFIEDIMWAHPAAPQHLKQRDWTSVHAAYWWEKSSKPVAKTSKSVIPNMKAIATHTHKSIIFTHLEGKKQTNFQMLKCCATVVADGSEFKIFSVFWVTWSSEL